jgi:DNA repair protein RadC
MQTYSAEMLRRIQEEGDSLSDEELIAILLHYRRGLAQPEELAQALMGEYHSLQQMFCATEQSLLAVPGMDRRTAHLLQVVKILLDSVDRERECERELVCTPEEAMELLSPNFSMSIQEQAYFLLLDQERRAICCLHLGTGSIHQVEIDLSKALQAAMRNGASYAVLAHCHPGGTLYPSHEDFAVTKQVQTAMGAVGVELVDHLIVADGDYLSMAEQGMMQTED